VEIPSKTVYVGLSGGVDSSVSAALLKEAGFNVVGVFIKVWQPDWQECNWRDDRLDAMSVCAKLGIPFKMLDLTEEYKREVVDYMIDEYKRGRTPNPDVMCNRYVKFGGFFDWAMREGADFVATGHYAQVVRVVGGDGRITHHLYAARDKEKDQSYFLWTLTGHQLSKTLFPIGHLIKKTEVRALAAKFGLSTAEKKDSQGLCFIGKINMKDFLKHYISEKIGDVIDAETGGVIGSHTGVCFFTLGERHGFTISKKTPTDQPYFVVGKDVATNTLIVSQKRSSVDSGDTASRVYVTNISWTGDGILSAGVTLSARIRYRQKLHECGVETTNGQTIIHFIEPQTAVAPGQSIVLYSGEECLGGGIIDRTE
jgi:tRNA-specific 2-thiouridylase